MKRRFLLIAYALLFNISLSFSQPVLGTAASKFVLFTTTGAITNDITPRSQITGDVGSNSASAVTGYVNINGVLQVPEKPCPVLRIVKAQRRKVRQPVVEQGLRNLRVFVPNGVRTLPRIQ